MEIFNLGRKLRDDFARDFAARGLGVEQRAFIETPHDQHPVHGWTFAADFKRAVATGDRRDRKVKFGRYSRVDFELAFQSYAAFFDC